jgi:hypothetical protein
MKNLNKNTKKISVKHEDHLPKVCKTCKETDEFSCVGCLKVRKDYKKE